MEAFGFDLKYPADMLELLSISRAELTENFYQLEWYEQKKGEVRIGGYSGEMAEGNSQGILVILIFKVSSNIRDKIILSITNPVDDFFDAFVITEISPLENSFRNKGKIFKH
jgi:hypothetical protein